MKKRIAEKIQKSQKVRIMVGIKKLLHLESRKASPEAPERFEIFDRDFEGGELIEGARRWDFHSSPTRIK